MKHLTGETSEQGIVYYIESDLAIKHNIPFILSTWSTHQEVLSDERIWRSQESLLGN